MKDPAFLFYPGDYLRDTQTLSEKAQVAYDRIMCEHMRNICISQSQLKFFTKKLNEDELDELMFVLNEIDGGFQIEWVAESIEKRRAYSESRRKNRISKPKKNKNNISKTYDKHMENEIENEIIDEKKIEIIYPFESENFKVQWNLWKQFKKKQFKFTFKSKITEQGALKKLAELAVDEDSAINIIHQSISNGWKGLYEIKTAENKTKQNKENAGELVKKNIYENGTFKIR